ncbi:MAG: DUF4252 domain-containing protein [Verrucomicrobiota bacterium]
MKPLTCLARGTAILTAALALNASAGSLSTGQVDFGAFSPPSSGGEFVEINVSDCLISLATRLVEKEEPEIAQLLKGIHLVRVNVIGLDDQNRPELEKRIAGIRKDLDAKGWERLVTARQQAQDVGIYLKTSNKDTVEGLVVLVMQGNKQAVLINVVGNIKPEQLSLLGDRLHIDELKKAGKAARK